MRVEGLSLFLDSALNLDSVLLLGRSLFDITSRIL